MTEAQSILAQADLRLACAEAIMTCGSVTLEIVAQSLGLTRAYDASEDAGKPWRKDDD